MAFPATPARKLLRGGAATARTVADGTGLGFDLDLDGAVRFLSGLWQLVVAKAAELAGLLAEKADELFPPETRRWWVHVTVTVVLPATLGALALFWFVRCCCCCCGASLGRSGRTMVGFVRCCCCCCGASRGRSGRTMVAPGRRGARMPRDAFEGDPRSYFRDLRANKALVY